MKWTRKLKKKKNQIHQVRLWPENRELPGSQERDRQKAVLPLSRDKRSDRTSHLIVHRPHTRLALGVLPRDGMPSEREPEGSELLRFVSHPPRRYRGTFCH